MASIVRCTLGGKRKSVKKLGSYLWHQPKSIGRAFFNRVYYGNPLQYSCLENSMDRGAWWATVHGVAKSQTRLSSFHVTSLHTVYECMYFKTAMRANFSVPTLTCKKEYIELIVIISQYIHKWHHYAVHLKATTRLVTQSCLTPAIPRTVARQAPLSLGFSRRGHWSALPCPSPGDLPNPGIKPRSPTLQADSLPAELPGKPL